MHQSVQFAAKCIKCYDILLSNLDLVLSGTHLMAHTWASGGRRVVQLKSYERSKITKKLTYSKNVANRASGLHSIVLLATLPKMTTPGLL